ncbi:MAG TPA: hypothetical protein VHZ95_07885 [Polyangiales bacterium]|nr:hypothetical protein [Polyangiales bacterium]
MALACARVGVVLSAALLFACGGQSGGSQPATTQVCTPGTIYSCVQGSCNGHQSCNSDGTVMSKCACDDVPSAGKSGDDAGSEPRDAAMPDDAGQDAATTDAQAPTDHEICDNGKDDDGDGKIDCADSDCPDVACVTKAPDGWRGPIALATGDDVPSDCSGAFGDKAFEAGTEPSADATSCSACTCSGDNACAAFVDFGTGSDAACGGATCTTSVNQSCAEIMPPCLNAVASAYLQTKLPASSGACTPSTETPNLPETHWKSRAIGCALSAADGGGCDKDVCAPKSAGDRFQTNFCIWQEGDVACPSKTYTDKQLLYRDLSDTRSCSACVCSGPNCSYDWKVFADSDTTCTMPLLSLSSPDQCVQVNPVGNMLRVGAAISGDGKCTPTGGQPQGQLQPTNPITVCCH